MIIPESINNISIIDLLNKNEVPAKNIIFEQYELIKLIFFEALSLTVSIRGGVWDEEFISEYRPLSFLESLAGNFPSTFLY